jgi:hypothetical protein
VHVADAGAVRERLNARVTQPGKEWDQVAREVGMTGVDEIVAAAARPAGRDAHAALGQAHLVELADEVLARPQG